MPRSISRKRATSARPSRSWKRRSTSRRPMETGKLPHRYPTEDDWARSHPVHAVWEITLACNLKCIHCGSRAGKARPSALTTEECLDVVRQPAPLRVRGGSTIAREAFLRRGGLDLMPHLAELLEEPDSLGVMMIPANALGYFGPYEHRWRAQNVEFGYFQGCSAGHVSLGIEADGTIKGCPSLPTSEYAGGNVRDLTIEQIWNHSGQLRFTRDRTVEDLWGFCRTCYYADVCRGGCTWSAHSLLGRAGNNPYCHHRALTLAKEGKRERIVKVQEAGPRSFDTGRFALLLEPLDGNGEGVVQEPPPARPQSEIP